MRHLIEFPLNGGSAYVEVDEPEDEDSTVRAARPESVIEQARTSFDDALKTIRPVTERMIAHLQDLAQPPDELGLEFALKLSGKAHVFVFSADTEGSFKVTMKWKRDPHLAA